MKIKITDRVNNEIAVGDYESLKAACAANRADLRGAYLRGAYLHGADLRDADLRDADLHGAYLRDADLRDADLRDADLRDADLRGADLRDADLRDADLSGADLSDYFSIEIAEKQLIETSQMLVTGSLEGERQFWLDILHDAPADLKVVLVNECFGEIVQYIKENHRKYVLAKVTQPKLRKILIYHYDIKPE